MDTKHALQMGCTPHGAAVDFGQAKAGVVRSDDDVGRAAHANAPTQHKTVHRHNDRHRVEVDGFEGGVVARVHMHDQALIGGQFFDVYPRAKAPALCSDDDDAYLGAPAQGLDLGGQGIPASAIEGIDRRRVKNDFSHAVGMDCGGKRCGHDRNALVGLRRSGREEGGTADLGLRHDAGDDLFARLQLADEGCHLARGHHALGGCAIHHGAL